MNERTSSHRVTSAEVVNIGPALAGKLRALAVEHQRDFVGEGRAAVRFYLEMQGRAPAQESAAATMEVRSP